MSKNPGATDWRRYYEIIGARPPRETLLFALDRFEAEGRPADTLNAVDLGCGNGRDTIEMLRRGVRVLAIDAQADAIEGLRARPDLPEDARLETRVGRFQEVTWPEVDLVNAGFSLPLVAPEDFPPIWRRIVESLAPGGRFSGHLFGDRDSWVGNPSLTFFSREEVDALLGDMEVEHFREEEEDSTTPRGTPKHWHIFHVVARKR